jgi:sugar/nucleoside kinase (ribokinase family)
VKAFARPPSRKDAVSPGAGDAFGAAVLVTLARGRSLDEALTEGCRQGLFAVAGAA